MHANLKCMLAPRCRYMGRDAQLLYLAREKAKGVPHHNKAGNINSALLKESPGAGAFVLVLDCDMVVHPDFLQATLGHFYCQMSEGRWKLKPKAAFLQTPQVRGCWRGCTHSTTLSMCTTLTQRASFDCRTFTTWMPVIRSSTAPGSSM